MCCVCVVYYVYFDKHIAMLANKLILIDSDITYVVHLDAGGQCLRVLIQVQYLYEVHCHGDGEVTGVVSQGSSVRSDVLCIVFGEVRAQSLLVRQCHAIHTATVISALHVTELWDEGKARGKQGRRGR